MRKEELLREILPRFSTGTEEIVMLSQQGDEFPG
jgi:hypothetical protein